MALILRRPLSPAVCVMTPPRQHIPVQYAADAITVMNNLGWNQAHWVGTSMGGLIALTLGATPGNESRLLGLVLNDVGPHVPADTLRHIVSYAGKEKVFLDANVAKQFLQNTYREFKPMTDADWDDMLQASVEPATAWVAAQQGQDPHAVDQRPGVDVRAKAELWSGTGPVEQQAVPPGADLSAACRLRYDARIGDAFPPPSAISADVDLWAAWAALHAQDMLVLHGAVSGVLTADTAKRMVDPAEATNIRGRRHLLDIQLPGCGHVPSLRDAFQTQAVVAFLKQADADAR